MSARSLLLLPALCLMVAGLAAADGEDDAAGKIDWQPTRLTWEAGDKTLAEAVAWLSEDGNRTTLHPNLDGNVLAPVAFVEGTYWEAVQAVCRAYNLYVTPPIRYRHVYGGSNNAHSIYTQVEAGPVELALLPGETLLGHKVDRTPSQVTVEDPDLAKLREDPAALRRFLAGKIRKKRSEQQRSNRDTRPDTLYHPSHMFLVCIEDAGIWTSRSRSMAYSRAGIAFRLRIEPRIDMESIGPCQLNWYRAFASNGTELAFFPPGYEGDRQYHKLENLRHYHQAGQLSEHGRLNFTCTQLYGIDAKAGGFGLSGELLLAHLDTFEKTYRLKPGDKKTTPGPQKIELEFTKDGGNGTLIIKYRRDEWVGQPQIQLKTPTGKQQSFYFNRSSTSNHRCTSQGAVDNLQEGAYRITLKASRLLSQPELPVAIEVSLP